MPPQDIAQSTLRNRCHWWVSLILPEGGASITLTTVHENMKPGTMKLFFATSDIAAAHKELSAKVARVNGIKDDLFGPGSRVKWFKLWQSIHLVQQ